MRWSDDGLVIWPAAAGADPGCCPFPLAETPHAGSWPDPPSGFAAGIYWRSAHHAPAPQGLAEVVMSGGGAFGTGDHPTTRMCLELLRRMPPGPALDAGCGSGILALAWARLGKGSVLASDPDPQAARQSAASAALSGLADLIDVRAARIGALPPAQIDGRVLLANLPPAGHDEILATLSAPPPAALLSGLRSGEGRAIAGRYRALGLRATAVARRRGWECWLLERAA